jgi:hypothetical protein
MSIEKKLLGTTSGGDAPNVEDVFSTYLWTGTGAHQTITNGIDLDGEGGMVWTKGRAVVSNNVVIDTVRGEDNYLYTNTTGAEETDGNFGIRANSDGFDTSGVNFLVSGREHVSWTFRKAPRFFDVVTYSGNSTDGREIAHNLGVAPGMIIVKSTSTAGYRWVVYHKTVGAQLAMYLDGTEANDAGNYGVYSSVPTESVFKLSTSGYSNETGHDYVAYLFAHDPVGENDDGMIACGSYTGTGANQDIDLGWEAQYTLIKKTNASGTDWQVHDMMRGMAVGGNDNGLKANSSGAEWTAGNYISPNASGFTLEGSSTQVNASSATYIYMAIRAPMMKEPEAGTEVFAIDTQDGTPLPSFKSTFPIDMQISKYTSVGVPETNARLTDKRTLETSSTIAEGAKTSASFAFMNGWGTGTGTDSTYYSWMFKRAKGFFDVVAYSGNSTVGRTVNHSLGAVPEMVIFKCRNAGEQWYTYHHGINGGVSPEDYAIYLNLTNTPSNTNTFLNDTAPTSTNFTVHSGNQINGSTKNYIAYLFATLDGVSKVGNYTGNGSSQNIACGFSAGARFVLIKRTDSTGDWYIWDTTRGIVTGNDPHLSLNTTAAEVTTDDSIDPQSAGFTVNQVSATNINVSSATYIFLAIA